MEQKNNLKFTNSLLSKRESYKILDMDERSRKIFKLIVDDFLKDGKPIGSRKLSIKNG